MDKHAAFFFQLGRMLRRVVSQEPDKFVTEEVPVPLPLASEVHGLESSDLKRPIPEIRPHPELIELPPHGHTRVLHNNFRVIKAGQKRRDE